MAIPTVVLAEVVSGRAADAPTDRVVKAVDLELELTGERARQAGVIRSRAWMELDGSPRRTKGARPPCVVDAIVVAEALAAGSAVILTSDREELELLRDAADPGGARRVRVVGA